MRTKRLRALMAQLPSEKAASGFDHHQIQLALSPERAWALYAGLDVVLHTAPSVLEWAQPVVYRLTELWPAATSPATSPTAVFPDGVTITLSYSHARLLFVLVGLAAQIVAGKEARSLAYARDVLLEWLVEAPKATPGSPSCRSDP